MTPSKTPSQNPHSLSLFPWGYLILALSSAAVAIGILFGIGYIIKQSADFKRNQYDCPPPSYEIIINQIDSLQTQLRQIQATVSNSTDFTFAEIVSTNLVHVPCTCGYCRPSEGIAVPEHINQIGYDLKVVVSTSYYPVVILPKP